MRPDPAVEAGTVQCGRAVERADAVVGVERERTDRRPVVGEMRAGERVRLRVEHEVDVALLVERDVLGAVPAGAAEAEAFQSARESGRGSVVDRKFDEGHPFDRRRGRRIE